MSRVSWSSRAARAALVALAFVGASSLVGCAKYIAPGGAASFRAMGITPEQQSAMTDTSIRDRMERKPLANFPARVAVARVQAPQYSSHTSQGWGRGSFTVVTNRDVEQKIDMDRIEALPMLAGVAPLNRLVLPERLDGVDDLRRAAASVQADMLLVYTFDTVFRVDDAAAPLTVFTLGLFPGRFANVTTTASAALVDTRNGFVYGLAEASEKSSQLANAWTDGDAVDQCRRRTEGEAFTKLVGELQTMWTGVVRTHASGATPPDASAGER